MSEAAKIILAKLSSYPDHGATGLMAVYTMTGPELGTILDELERRPHTGGGSAVAFTGSGSLRAVEMGLEGHIYRNAAPAHPIGLYAAPPTAWKPDREAVARIIDPEIFEQAKNFPKVIGLSRWNRAFAKADQILALQQQEGSAK